MKAILPAAVTSLLLALPMTASAQTWPGAPPAPMPAYPYANQYANPYGSPYGAPYRVPYANPYAPVNLSGIWYMDGDRDKPARIIQYSPTRALFINEHGSRAWGTVQGNHVWIPDWTFGKGWNTHQGLWGTVIGNRLQWPDGSFWSRY